MNTNQYLDIKLSLEVVPITESSTCMQQQQEQEAVTHGSESLNGGETAGQDHAPCPTAQKDGNLADEVSVYLFFL